MTKLLNGNANSVCSFETPSVWLQLFSTCTANKFDGQCCEYTAHKGHMAHQLLCGLLSGYFILVRFSTADFVRSLSQEDLFLALREHEEHLRMAAALLSAPCLHLPSQMGCGAGSIVTAMSMLTSAAVLDSYISLRAPRREREESSRAVWLPRCLLLPPRLGCLDGKASSCSAMTGPWLGLQQYSDFSACTACGEASCGRACSSSCDGIVWVLGVHVSTHSHALASVGKHER